VVVVGGGGATTNFGSVRVGTPDSEVLDRQSSLGQHDEEGSRKKELLHKELVLLSDA
jgi:hypothetical protein